ncbi:uncharacterized protein LOC121401392 [Xenopus laevis]|uniref:Uncharacterized protein LOC121401392 n=1 Tax=Xenopus laevis TaxID=8355 RepID=A0A8J1MJJ6_XENLA|nr:uncharacterized protein LOC121401392 [Xenopus laevis]
MKMLVKNLNVIHYEQLKAGADSQKSLHFFINFLESNGCLICDKPVEAEDPIDNPVPDGEENEEDHYEDDMDIEDPLLMLSTSASKMSSKKIMKEAGIHKKHSTDSPLLQAFRGYLEKKYAKSGIKHELDTVSRWLHFVNPNEALVSCIHNIGGVKKFISYKSPQTFNCWKRIHLCGPIKSFSKSMTEVQKSTFNKEKSVGREGEHPTHQNKPSEKELSYKYIEDKFPVGPDTNGPTLKQCQAFSELHGRYCYNRWRRQQKQIHMDVIISH